MSQIQPNLTRLLNKTADRTSSSIDNWPLNSRELMVHLLSHINYNRNPLIGSTIIHHVYTLLFERGIKITKATDYSWAEARVA